jgi:hypothetical protein
MPQPIHRPFERPSILALHPVFIPDPGLEAAIHDADPAPAETAAAGPGTGRPLRSDPESVPPADHRVPVHDSPLHPESAALHTDHHRRILCHSIPCGLTVLAENRISTARYVPDTFKSW